MTGDTRPVRDQVAEALHDGFHDHLRRPGHYEGCGASCWQRADAVLALPVIADALAAAAAVTDPDLPEGVERPAPVEVDAETFAAMEALAQSRDAASWAPWQAEGATLPATLNEQVQTLQATVDRVRALPKEWEHGHRPIHWHGFVADLLRALDGATQDARTCHCPPCPGRGTDGHGMTHCAECCFGSGVEADEGCPVHGATQDGGPR